VADIFTIGLSQGMTGGNSFGDGGGEKGIDFVFGMMTPGAGPGAITNGVGACNRGQCRLMAV
jgi:hypothetical protein